MAEDDLDLAMRARMAEEDAAQFREALMHAVFRGATRPSDDTLIAFAVAKIEHSRRVTPDNETGRPAPLIEAAAYRDAVLALTEKHNRSASLADKCAEEFSEDTEDGRADLTAVREWRALAWLHRHIAAELRCLVADVERAAEADR